MHSNDLEPAIQDEESFRTAVTDFLKENCEQIGDSESTLEAVSYTHLTLPTICSV